MTPVAAAGPGVAVGEVDRAAAAGAMKRRADVADYGRCRNRWRLSLCHCRTRGSCLQMAMTIQTTTTTLTAKIMSGTTEATTTGMMTRMMTRMMTMTTTGSIGTCRWRSWPCWWSLWWCHRSIAVGAVSWGGAARGAGAGDRGCRAPWFPPSGRRPRVRANSFRASSTGTRGQRAARAISLFFCRLPFPCSFLALPCPCSTEKKIFFRFKKQMPPCWRMAWSLACFFFELLCRRCARGHAIVGLAAAPRHAQTQSTNRHSVDKKRVPLVGRDRMPSCWPPKKN